MKYEFGFIGCGNMGGVLAEKVASAAQPFSVAVCDYFQEKAEAIREKYPVVVTTAEEIAEQSKIVVLGVKPQAMEQTLTQIKGCLEKNEGVVLLSMAAALSIEAILNVTGKEYPMIRIMPNTPCMKGKGVLLYACRKTSEQTENAFQTAFSNVGALYKMEEEDMDAVGALTGCGPAFAYLFAEGLAQGAAACGVEKKQAVEYAARILIGAGEMLLGEETPEVLTKKVCSPGGTTIEGVKILENGAFLQDSANAVVAAYKRTLELKK